MTLSGADPAALLAHDERLRALARALVHDPGRADDLVQDTWVAALRHPRPIASLSGFAGRVVRRLAGRDMRGSARRSAREEAAARSEATPSAADILEREDTRRRVVEALLALDEPFRTTLVLRFLEGLPPRALARRMGVPLETVRSRTRRGLADLRARLDGEFGTRERWLAGLFPLLRSPSHIVSLALMTKLAAVLLVPLCVWFLWPRSVPSQVSGATAPVSAAADPEPRVLVEDALALAPVAEPTAGERVPAAPPAPRPALATAETGALRARVVVHCVSPGHPVSPRHPVGVTPLAGVRVRVISDALENPDLHALEAVTDDGGYALFQDLPAGGAWVTVDRHFAEPKPAAVRAGATLEMEIGLLEGFTIAGRVIDEAQRPVAGAEIWLGKFPDLANGACVARSGPDGAFRLPSLLHANIGARAPGYRPSRIAHFYAAPGAEVPAELVLRASGGAVRGAVVGPAGAPVSGALVRVGPPGPRDHHGEHELDADWGALARTDEHGRFELAGLASGPSPVLVRCGGFALFRGAVDVPAGGTATFTAALAPEAALAGHVRDAAGAPATGVLVRVGAEEGPFRACGRTRDDGGFRVGALEAGVPLTAWVEGGPGVARTEVTLEAGETRTWEVVLDPLGEIRGRVVDGGGAPLARWSVRLEEETPTAEPDQGLVPTEADGSFAFQRVHDRPHRVSVAAPDAGIASSLVLSGVRPGRGELVLRVPDAAVPSARVSGRFVDGSGRPLPSAQILPMTLGAAGMPVETCDPETGAFDLGPFTAGPMRLFLRAEGRGAIVREHALAAGETWDLGEVRLVPDGHLRLQLRPGGVDPDPRLRFAVEPGFPESFEGAGLARRSPPLAPGAYVLAVRGGDVEELALPFEIQSGAETVLDVPLRRGWRVPVAARVPATVQIVFLRIRLPDGATLERKLFRREGELLVETLRLPAGAFPVEASAFEPGASERLTSGTLVVEPHDREDPALVLALD